jgi:hypothetical protein
LADNFFKHFPVISYSNNVCVNLLAKVGFRKSLDKSYYTFHPYTIEEGDRPDTIAYLYYGDPGFDWIVYFSNDIVDPYYDWYMDSDTFSRFIESKYGSVYDAQSKVKFYRTNYYDDFSIITPQYFNALSNKQKSYWSPVTGIDNKIVSYERKKEEVVRSTNKTFTLDTSLVGNTQFITNENVFQESGGIKTAVGNLKSLGSNTSTMIIDNIVGSFSNTLNIKGEESNANASVSLVTLTSTTISSEEINYYVPVSYWDYENEKNEQKKNILLLDVGFVEAVTEEFKNLMSI